MRLILILFSASMLLPFAAAQAEPRSELEEAKDRLKSLEERLDKLEGAPAKASISSFNPAMGMALDAAYGHADGKGGFLFRAAELNVESPIDPFLKGWAVFTGSDGTAANGSPTLDIEEAALETTALKSLTFRGGRLFAAFGRMAHFHDHELPVMDRPNSLNNFIGGETRADGLEASWLLPTSRYVNAVFGMYDKMGTNNARTDPQAGRPLDNFTYLGRLSSYQDIGDNHSVELGVDSAWTPKRYFTDSRNGMLTRRNTWRALSGLDFTYRYQPAQGGLYRGLVWGTEVLQNNERRAVACVGASPAAPGGPFTTPDTASCAGDRVRSYGGYSYIQVKMGPRLRPGVMADLSESLDSAHNLTKTFSAFLTCDVSEFQRVRLVYARTVNNVAGMPGSHTIELQWTGVMGHHVHGFRDR